MNCHNVVNLFNNVPIPAAMDVIMDRFVMEKILSKETNLQAEDIMDFVELVIETTYFKFHGVLYSQVHGAPTWCYLWTLIWGFNMNLILL